MQNTPGKSPRVQIIRKGVEQRQSGELEGEEEQEEQEGVADGGHFKFECDKEVATEKNQK